MREPAGLPARLAAAEILHAVIDRKRPFDEVFGAAAAGGSLAGFDHRDRGLVRLIVVTALRRRGQIDDVLARFVERPLPSGAGIARAILACATAQLLFLDTPAHAAIGLAVAAADRRARRYKGLVNAVLRRVAEHGPAQVAAHDAPRINTPDWLWRRWTAAYGAATTRAIAEVHLNEPALDLTVRHDPEEWADRLGGHVTPTGTVRTTRRGAVDTLPGYSDGAWWVQDMAAAIPARLLGDISGKTVLDLCAAPGGKTAQLAAAGAEVVAVDVSPRRLRLVEQNLSRLGLKAQTVEADILAWQPDRPFDAILLDAPCTSTGTIRRHPDVAHLKTADAVTALAALQGRMLDRAVGWLAPGGTLVYCTCSLEPEEGPGQVARILAGQPVARNPLQPAEVGGLAELISGDGDLRTLPCHYDTGDPATGGMDGLFAARLVRQ